ncbi:ECF-type sigma factor [Lysobacter sp. ESA13C]|uniref:ECF-type sigma factor n=1 Tax=Lysobacter sp. ESA13C TaxID=2862676 RepID=UPI001CC1832D
MDSITRLLTDARGGQADAWTRIYALLYDDLQRLARSQLSRHAPQQTMSPTSLISETWLRLSQVELTPGDRQHLFGLLARAMRYVLIDDVRRKQAERHGGGQQIQSLDSGSISEMSWNPGLERLLAMDQALLRLAKFQPRLAQVVEWRYFGGMSETEIAEILDVDVRTVRRDWQKARAFLLRQLGGDGLHLETQ